MAANERQVGGDHYKIDGEEHWDRIWRICGAGYFIGSITKYVERYRFKNGVEDLRKAAHFLEKLIELEGSQPKVFTVPAPDARELSDEERQHLYDLNRSREPREYMTFDEWFKKTELNRSYYAVCKNAWDTGQKEMPF